MRKILKYKDTTYTMYEEVRYTTYADSSDKAVTLSVKSILCVSSTTQILTG